MWLTKWILLLVCLFQFNEASSSGKHPTRHRDIAKKTNHLAKKLSDAAKREVNDKVDRYIFPQKMDGYQTVKKKEANNLKKKHDNVIKFRGHHISLKDTDTGGKQRDVFKKEVIKAHKVHHKAFKKSAAVQFKLDHKESKIKRIKPHGSGLRGANEGTKGSHGDAKKDFHKVNMNQKRKIKVTKRIMSSDEFTRYAGDRCIKSEKCEIYKNFCVSETNCFRYCQKVVTTWRCDSMGGGARS